MSGDVWGPETIYFTFTFINKTMNKKYSLRYETKSVDIKHIVNCHCDGLTIYHKHHFIPILFQVIFDPYITGISFVENHVNHVNK